MPFSNLKDRKAVHPDGMTAETITEENNASTTRKRYCWTEQDCPNKFPVQSGLWDSNNRGILLLLKPGKIINSHSEELAINSENCGAGFFLLPENFGRIFNNSFPTCAFLFFLFFKVEISLYTLIPLFRPGSVHSGSASWDDCDLVFPYELRMSSFLDRFLHNACTAA